MQVSSYLIVPLIALQNENELHCAVRRKKVRMHEEKRACTTKQCYFDPLYNTQYKLQDYQSSKKLNNAPVDG